MLTTVLHICLHCFGTCGSICESSLFSFCSRTLDIRSDRLWQVRNIHVIPRILHALDVKTGCVVWSHEANAATGNNVQWGYHRLPSKSWLISLLSFFSITHYVDVPYNLKEIKIVGPVDATIELIRLSQELGSNDPVDFADLNPLKYKLGIGPGNNTKADKICRRIESGAFGISIGIICCICMFWFSPVSRRFFLGSVLLLACLLFVRFYCGGCAGWSLLHRPVLEQIADVDSRELRLLSDNQIPEVPDAVGVQEGPDTATLLSSDDSPEDVISCSLMYVREQKHFYTAKTLKVLKSVSLDLEFDTCVRLYAVRIKTERTQNCVYEYISRVPLEANFALHVLVHNPLYDPTFSLLCEDLTSGAQQQNCLLVVWPRLETLDAFLTSQQSLVLHTTMRTLCDFECMLMQISSGILPSLIIVMPVMSLPDCETWKSAQWCLGQNNCVYLP